MAIAQITSFIMSLAPFLNTGVVTLITNLLFERFGFKVTRREFKREPLKSLFRGLCLIILAGLSALIIQTQLSGFEPLLAFIVLLVVYLAFAQI